MNSLENRRLMCDELVLYKIQNSLLVSPLRNSLSFYNINRVTRLNQTSYVSTATSNIEKFAPMLRLQRQLNDSFPKMFN